MEKVTKKGLISKARKAGEAGFTMVEMLIVIALIGLIIAFLFSKLGNSFTSAATSQAATQIADDMRSINDATQKYSIEKASNATGFADLATASNGGGPFLAMTPVSPSTIGSPAYTWDSATNVWGTVMADTSVKITIPAANIGVCQAINFQFAGAASAGTAVPGAVNAALDFQCFGAGPYTAVKSIYIN